MIGANPKCLERGRALRRSRTGAAAPRIVSARRRLLATVVSLSSLLLAQCDNSPEPGAIAANAARVSDPTFDQRYPTTLFSDRFPSPAESLELHSLADFSPKPAMPAEPAPSQLASTDPQASILSSSREELTTLVSMKSSAFPYSGNNPASDAPFLDVTNGERRGHRSLSGRVYWQDQTYNDSRVLVHVPEHFDVHKPGVIVVFFHGNGATLERDVRDRQLLPQQVSESGVNAVLLAPQLAVDAADSSAGKFWQAGGFKRFMDEAALNLARLTGDPSSAKAFASMPIIIVGYSGGFLPTAWSLDVGGITDRVRGVVLLDAVYGQLEKFAGWIERNRSGFFVSAYTHYTARHDRELIGMLRDKGIAVSDNIEQPLRPGSVVFVETPDGVTLRDYVTSAWTRNPVTDVLTKMAAAQPPIRIATGNPNAASR
jgi:hypothetical protein